MTSSFRPGAAQMATARPMQTVQYQPSRATHVPSSSTHTRVASGGSPQYNSGAPSFSTIQSWADNNAFLDIYMVNAFYLGTGQKSEYFMSFWKTATCFGLQFGGILLLMEDQWRIYNSESKSCDGPKGNVAWIAFLFATYITMFCTEQIRTLNRYGMYGWGENQPEFVNSFWVGIGLWTNLFSLVLSWFVSCIVIFTSGDLLEMILNAVAVTFMLTLDDEIIGESDYNRIKNWDQSDRTICKSLDTIWTKIGGCLLKIHPCWQRRYQVKSCVIECCDIILIVPMVIIPWVVLTCYPNADQLCLYEGVDSLCVDG